MKGIPSLTVYTPLTIIAAQQDVAPQPGEINGKGAPSMAQMDQIPLLTLPSSHSQGSG